jgi:hypothetical protein
MAQLRQEDNMRYSLRVFGLGCLAVGLGWGPAAGGQPNTEEQAAKAVTGTRGTGIVIDGNPTEGAWTTGPWHTGFTTAGSGAPAPVETRFAVRYDDTCLYLAAILQEPRIAELRTLASEHDGKVWSDDCIEFMIDPTGDRVEYVHLAVNAKGAIYDSQVRQGGHVSTSAWDSTAKAAGNVGTDAWSVEVAIPFTDLGLVPRSATQAWAIQVGRERYATGTIELSAYMRSGGSFHVPSTYAPLVLEGADLARFLWEVKGPLAELVVSGQDGLVYQFRALVTNGSGRFRFTTLKATLRGEAGESAVERTGGHDDGQQQTYAFAVPLAASGQHLLTLSVSDRQQPEVPLAVRRVPLVLSYTPLRLKVLRPCYRNTIYATERLTEVIARVELQLPDGQLKGVRLAARLLASEEEGSAVVATGQATTDTRLAEVRLPLADLAEGRHLLAVTATLASGESFAANTVIRKVPAVPHEWRLDENLVLLHNGEPFFPYGWFSAPTRDAQKLAAEGVTLVQEYNAQWFPPERTLKWLDELQQAGLYGTFYPWPSSQFMANFKEPVSAEEEAAVRERVRAFRDHPALLAYYLWDEPELQPLLVDRGDRLYQIIADEDPYHPCIMLNDTIPGIHTYRNGGDILMPDPYPLFSRGALAGRPIEYTAMFMRACREASAGEKAWWVTPQAFDYYMNQKNSRQPNLTELRNQQLQSLINGARGVVWYTYSHRYNFADLDLGVPFVGREAQRLRAAILAPELPDAIAWEAEAREHIQAAVRQVGQTFVIFTVNTRTAPQTATFTLKAPDVKTLYVVSENRTVNVDQGRFSDTFALYEGHIYTTDAELAAGPTVGETEAAIAREEAARRKPGNLAHRERGSTVTASSTQTYSGALWMVTDGAVLGDGWRDHTPRQFPDWLQVALSEPATIARVEVYSRSIDEYEIQLEQNGQLTTVASGRRPETGPIVARFAPAEASAVRVVAKSGNGDLTEITEVEVYGP